MSYILEALRRAESQRSLGKVPGLGTPLGTLPSDGARSRRRDVPAAVWIAGVAASTVVGAWLVWQYLWPATTAAPPPPPIAVDAPRLPKSVTSPAPPPVDVQASIAPSRLPTGPRFGTPAAAPAASAADGIASSAAPAALAPAPPVAAVAPASPPTMPASATAAPTAAAATAPARIVGVNDLPADVRQQLPALALSGSVYSETPAARLLVANGQLAREGDVVAPGVTLQQIQPRGAVVLFRGYRVLLPF